MPPFVGRQPTQKTVKANNPQRKVGVGEWLALSILIQYFALIFSPTDTIDRLTVTYESEQCASN